METDQFTKTSGRWNAEQELLEKVRRGDMSVRDVLARMQPSHTVSITDYIQQSKLERAKYLLANSQTTVDEISDSLGFGTKLFHQRI